MTVATASQPYARLLGGVVAETYTPPAGFVMADCHRVDPEDPACDWVTCGPDVAPGWVTTDSGRTFAPPTAPAPAVRRATTYELMSALTDAQRTAYPGPTKAWDQRMFSARDTPWPESNEKIARIAAALNTTPKAWFDAALNPPAS